MASIKFVKEENGYKCKIPKIILPEYEYDIIHYAILVSNQLAEKMTDPNEYKKRIEQVTNHYGTVRYRRTLFKTYFESKIFNKSNAHPKNFSSCFNIELNLIFMYYKQIYKR